jgi:predicted transcriptional regulator
MHTMSAENPNMAKSTTMTVRIPPEVNDKLDLLARDTKRTKAYLAGEAIAAYVERNAWQVARIKGSLDDAKSGSPGVPHAAVEQWVQSWDTEHELPTPEATP